jgi:hypothetical protein
MLGLRRSLAVLASCAAVSLVCSTRDLHAQPYDGVTFGLNLGAAYTPDDELTGIGWNVEGTVEGLVGQAWELRGTVGGIGLEGDAGQETPKATYTYLLFDVLRPDLISPTYGIGLFHVDLDPPLVGESQSTFEFGANVGVRLMIPYSTKKADHAFTLDARIHGVLGDGPSLLFTFGAGILF